MSPLKFYPVGSPEEAICLDDREELTARAWQDVFGAASDTFLSVLKRGCVDYRRGIPPENSASRYISVSEFPKIVSGFARAGEVQSWARGADFTGAETILQKPVKGAVVEFVYTKGKERA